MILLLIIDHLCHILLRQNKVPFPRHHFQEYTLFCSDINLDHPVRNTIRKIKILFYFFVILFFFIDADKKLYLVMYSEAYDLCKK